MNNDTIVALATPVGKAGVAIVRMSGERAKDIAEILAGQISRPREMCLCTVALGVVKDEALVVYFAKPNSFTGEDVVEIQCHGGMYLASKIIDECVRHGARLATRGEYSMRAYINGKMSIDQAEGICDLINAESARQAKSAEMLMRGQLADVITLQQDVVKDILANIEADLDYPEYDLDVDKIPGILAKTDQIINILQSLKSTYTDGRKIADGVQVAIVGAPNAGKSSLMNAMVGRDVAIVTDIAGTTRDIVTAEYEYSGVKYILYDTAGIRDSSDVVEQIGVERARQKQTEADIVLSVVTPDQPSVAVDADIVVCNKSDFYTYDSSDSVVSTISGEGIDELKCKIHHTAFSKDISNEELYITNSRHDVAIADSLVALERARQNIGTHTLDMIAFDYRLAWTKLGEITGSTASQEVVDRIFEKFCIGK